MIIEKLHINSFGALSDFTLELTGGINIIEGANESGKTTVAAFCAYILYGFDKGDKSERALRTSWDGSAVSGFLCVRHGDSSYRIEREGAARGEKVRMIDIATGEQCHKGEVPGEVLLGIPYELFTQTAYVGQAGGSAVGGGSLETAIENILFSGDEAVNTQRALKKIDELRVSLLHKNGRGGRISEMKEERDRLRAKLTEASQRNAKVIEAEGQLAKAKASLEEKQERRRVLDIRVRYNETDTLLKRFDEFKRVRQSGSELKEEYSAIINAGTHNGFLPDQDYAATVSALGNEIDSLQRELNDTDAEYERLSASEPDRAGLTHISETVDMLGGGDEVARHYASLIHSRTLLRVFGAICCVLAVMSAGCGIYFGLFGNNLTLSAIFAAGFLTFAVIAVLLLYRAVRPDRDARGLLEELGVDDRGELKVLLGRHESVSERLNTLSENLDELDGKRISLKGKLTDRRNKLNELLGLWDKSDVAEAVSAAGQLYQRLGHCKSELEKQYSAYNMLKPQLAGYDESELREQYPALKEAYDSLERDDGELNMTALKRELDFTTKAVSSLTDRCHTLETQLAELYAVTVRPAPIAERLATLDNAIDDAQKRLNACVTAYDALSRGADNLRRSISPRLSANAGMLMSEATEGRYGEISVDGDMTMQYESSVDGHMHSVSFMSAGTSDLAYISLRLSLIALLCPNDIPPVIFDESFSRLDDTRLTAMLRIIAAYSGDGSQVIILTSQKRDALLTQTTFNHIKL